MVYLLAIQLAIALIFQDEAPYLKEWIEYYRMVGAEHFYFYNNHSRDHYLEVLQPYLDSGLVELKDWPQNEETHWPRIQRSAYKDALGLAGRDGVTWLAIVDADEFLVPRTKESLTSLLADYENATIGEVRVGWVCFGTSFVDKIPEGRLMIETLLLNGGYRSHSCKSVVRPTRVDIAGRGSPHVQPLYEPFKSVSLPFELAQCNHYWTRDAYYLNQVKIPRKTRLGFPLEKIEELNDMFNQATPASEPILRFVPLLRERVFSDASQKALQ